MIESLKLTNFKNFKNAELKLGPFTVLVGANASGKSNLRDAFRFLHGIGLGYTIADIIGGKYVGGTLAWTGIRGGAKELPYSGAELFTLEANLYSPTTLVDSNERTIQDSLRHHVEIACHSKTRPSHITSESLVNDNASFVASPAPGLPDDDTPAILSATYSILEPVTRTYRLISGASGVVGSHAAIVQMIDEHGEKNGIDKLNARRLDPLGICVEAYRSMRFFEFHPDAMRQPSSPGQTTLGDRGENLSSVLQAICSNSGDKQALVHWLQELTPQDVVDFEFVPDLAGKVLVVLVESNGQKTSAYSASDGTMRFLAMLAALLGPHPAKFAFFEEIDTGIHPARLFLLVQMIEQFTKSQGIQVVATTHSPLLLRLLNEESREHATLIYRDKESPAAQIKRVMDIPDARRVIQEHDLASLFESGWLEDAMSFSQTQEASP